MALSQVKPDLVRYEMRVVQGQDPHVREQKKPGAFGRFLSGMGRVLGSIAMPMSFIFPPAAIGAAAMYGSAQIGDGIQARAYQKMAEKQQRDSMTQVSFPGLEFGGPSVVPAAGTVGAGDNSVMQVLDARGTANSQMSNGF